MWTFEAATVGKGEFSEREGRRRGKVNKRTNGGGGRKCSCGWRERVTFVILVLVVILILKTRESEQTEGEGKESGLQLLPSSSSCCWSSSLLCCNLQSSGCHFLGKLLMSHDKYFIRHLFLLWMSRFGLDTKIPFHSRPSTKESGCMVKSCAYFQLNNSFFI